ncbi:hypothetical protein G7Z17_g5425 [Cylindrodendrum hubeiense]|uniref:DUF6594 domain-containing protein n=1 Tax=Cylindrodendrum hubeiense TaxID=595255 RepID=A0A9P5HE56_9HYPO|nr:hypothetical protein G7Z17_g5425 [Cylindrodendrum hubeiense]
MSQPRLTRAETWHPGVQERDLSSMSPIEDEASTAYDLETGDNQEHALKGGFMGLCARGQQDTSQLVTRRYTQPTMFCLAKGAQRLDRLWGEYQEADQLGSDDDQMYLDFRRELFDHHRFTLQAKEIHGLDQPSEVFLENYIRGTREELLGEDTRYLDGPTRDWVLSLPIDRLDQLVRDIPHSAIGRAVFARVLEKTEENGDIQYMYYPLKAIKVVLAGVFNCIVASLVGAPVAIQSLSITSKAGEVIIYLVFLLVFGFLVQALVQGTNKQLFMTLAYAGVLAATMRQS